MPSPEALFTILKAKSSETIRLKEVQSFPLADGSLLMKWHETDVSANPERQNKNLDYATAIMPGYSNVRNLSTEDAWAVFNYKNEGQAGEQTINAHINPNSRLCFCPCRPEYALLNAKAVLLLLARRKLKAKQLNKLAWKKPECL